MKPRPDALAKLLDHVDEWMNPDAARKTRRLVAKLLRERADAAVEAADMGFTEGRGCAGRGCGPGRHGMSVQHRQAVLDSIRAAVLRRPTVRARGRDGK